MELRHLENFIAIARHGSVLKTALHLGLAQPALSRQMRDLEKEVGVELMERSSRGIRLTRAGLAFLEEARAVVRHARRGLQLARATEQTGDTVIRIAYSKQMYYPPGVHKLIASFRAARPQTSLRIHEIRSTGIPAALESNLVDAALLWQDDTDAPLHDAVLLVRPVFDGVLLPASAPIAAQAAVSLQQLKELRRVHLPRAVSPWLYEHVWSELAERGLDRSQIRSQPALVPAALMHIAAGHAWMLTSGSEAEAFSQSQSGVVFRPFTERPMTMRVVLQWQRRSFDRIRKFVEFIENA